jgi:DNA polymerase-3 subunit epsilon
MKSLIDSLAFVDLETTGATATHDRITEIGIVEIDADGTMREWSTLVNPGTSIPPFIESLTGISNAMVAKAPTFEALAPALAERLAGRLFIAHNARFDYGFLKNEFRRVDIDFRATVLCTVKLSRKLFPQHAKHNLDSLIARHGLKVDGRHRALADAQLIHQFWQQLQVQFDAPTLTEVVSKLTARPSLPAHVDPLLLDELPEGHGVYLFYGDNDMPLYVGKSKTLKKRIMAHFAADITSSKEMELSQQVRRIEWITTAGEIGALLREAALVKQLQPSHNRLLRRNDELCSWRLRGTLADGLQIELMQTGDEEFGRTDQQYGLFKTAREAKRALQAIADENALCHALLGLEKAVAGKPCFSHQLRKCRGACVGKETPAQHATRVVTAMAAMHLAVWPFSGPALLKEVDEVHVIDCWAYRGTAKDDSELHALLDAGRSAFDRDSYRILQKVRHRLRPANHA